MQYVRSFSGSVSKTWNSINPATLSGAIDVIVVEQEDGTLACSPFHVRFGKISLLRPYDKKVEFKVNNEKQDYSMKLGEGGEAFFVFRTASEIPESMQTSPLISPATSPSTLSLQEGKYDASLQEPDFLDLSGGNTRRRRPVSTLIDPQAMPYMGEQVRAQSDIGNMSPLSTSPPKDSSRPGSRWSAAAALAPAPSLERSASAELTPFTSASIQVRQREDERPRPLGRFSEPGKVPMADSPIPARSTSPAPLTTAEAISRAIALSKKLTETNIPNRVTDSGDLMLDMTGYKSSEEQALRAEVVARDILSQELDGNYDIGALIGADEEGNVWIYSSEEAKEAALRRSQPTILHAAPTPDDAISDPGYHSDGEASTSIGGTISDTEGKVLKSPIPDVQTPPQTPPENNASAGDPNVNYAKTLRLTSDQLRALDLKPGANSMSFSVNRAICQATMYYWKYGVPVVISDIDGTITKSDALGHVLNMIGRDWTHIGVAKLYTEIAANGYNILYLTSRSVGQSDTTRNYLNGVVQDGYRLPKGPVILSPDRTVAALRREVYLRKPEVFKMSCLRDIKSLFGTHKNPFYAGFGNRFTDALSYRSVDIPSNRIFTINSNAEVSLDLLTLSKYKSSYVSMQEILDHFFPPIGLLVASGGENFTDFTYWREAPLEVDDFSDSDEEDEEDGIDHGSDRRSVRSEDVGSDGYEDEEDGDDDDDDDRDPMIESFMSQQSVEEGGSELTDSMIEQSEDGQVSQRRLLDDGARLRSQMEDLTPTGRARGRSPSSREVYRE